MRPTHGEAPRIEAAGRAAVYAGAAVAAALVLAALWLPLWRMQLDAPQYPDGLELVAYGDRIAGDLSEVNIINHYIGMKEIAERPVAEMGLFRSAIVALALAALGGAASRVLLRLALAGAVALPIVILADLQLWLYRYGHDLDPAAPLRFVEPFTPLAIGISSIGNFRSFSMVSWGFVALAGAAVVLWLALRVSSRSAAPAAAALEKATDAGRGVAPHALILLVGLSLVALAGGSTLRAAAPGAGEAVEPRPAAELQARIDAAAPGDRLEVRGHYRGRILVRGPLALDGLGEADLDGGGAGTVVTIEGDGVELRGFAVRGSGREISREPAGIAATGSRHRIEGNRIEDVYFGVHLSNGAGNVVRGNRIRPAETPSQRPGHAISLWYQHGARVEDNTIESARDGVYVSFSEDVLVARNRVSGSRYGVHSMSSRSSVIEDNDIADNLLGAALMSSEGLVLRCNRITRHRVGATAYGVLLKDMAEVLVEGNELVGNRVAVYADNTPLGGLGEAVVAGNIIAGNGAALALQSTARLSLSGNALVNNLAALRLEGRQLALGSEWSRDGRGNYWDDYRGFDRDRDGIGDVPFRHYLALPALLRGDSPARALLWTPAHGVVEAAARLFPVVRALPVIDDPAPLVRPPRAQCSLEVAS